jgi:hypothetical protein
MLEAVNWYAKEHVCSQCETHWTDEWYCECNDECPGCGAETAPTVATPRFNPDIHTYVMAVGRQHAVSLPAIRRRTGVGPFVPYTGLPGECITMLTAGNMLKWVPRVLLTEPARPHQFVRIVPCIVAVQPGAIFCYAAEFDPFAGIHGIRGHGRSCCILDRLAFIDDEPLVDSNPALTHPIVIPEYAVGLLHAVNRIAVTCSVRRGADEKLSSWYLPIRGAVPVNLENGMQILVIIHRLFLPEDMSAVYCGVEGENGRFLRPYDILERLGDCDPITQVLMRTYADALLVC